MTAHYNIYFAGQLLAGHDLASVRGRLGCLFNADDATLDKLFSGKAQLVKRNCDKATDIKYQKAMEKAGALPLIKAAAEPASPAAPAPAKTMTAAERIAALAAAPDLAGESQTAPPSTATAVAPSPTAAPAADGAIGLAPAGTDVLAPQERPTAATSSVNAPDLEVFASGRRLSDEKPASPPPPDTSHLTTATVGELIPTLRADTELLSPDISGIELSPDGTDFSDCAAAAAVAPDLDLSGIALAAAGEQMLEPEYRRKHDESSPATDHITLQK